MIVDIPLITGHNAGFSENINAQQCVNLCPFFDETENAWAIYGRPGLKLDDTIWDAVANCRGAAIMGGNLWIVIGNRIYKHEADGTDTNKGTLDTSTGPVYFAVGSGSKLLFVDGTSGYTIVSDTFAKVTDADFPTPTSCCYIDGYYIVSKASSGDFYISASDDPTSWGATDYSTAEGSPDNLVRCIELDNNLCLLGDRSFELWFNSGNATFPFERIRGSILREGNGIGARASAAVFDKTLYWINEYGHVKSARGFSTQKNSNHNIDFVIQTYSDYSDAVGFIVPYQGFIFYVLTFPTTNQSLCYQINNGIWTEWASYGGAPGVTQRFQGSGCYAYFDNKHIFGDRAYGRIYELDNATYQDNSLEILRALIPRRIDQKGRRIIHNSLLLPFEPGEGALAVKLEKSDDNGNNWVTVSTITRK